MLTYDISRKQNFIMKATLIWTINNFPAYGMLSSWSTSGRLACPYCMNQSKAFRLKRGGKISWYDSHRQFLPMDHSFRRNKDAFYKNRIEKSQALKILTGMNCGNKFVFSQKQLKLVLVFVMNMVGLKLEKTKHLLGVALLENQFDKT